MGLFLSIFEDENNYSCKYLNRYFLLKLQSFIYVLLSFYSTGPSINFILRLFGGHAKNSESRSYTQFHTTYNYDIQLRILILCCLYILNGTITAYYGHYICTVVKFRGEILNQSYVFWYEIYCFIENATLINFR